MKRICLILFILVSAFSATTAVAQTTDRILAKGNPNLTESAANRIQGVFEWVFSSNFSGDQARRFRRILIGYWQNNSRNDIDSALGYLKIADLIEQLPENQRQNARAKLLAAISEAITKQPDDEMAKLLAEVYNKAENSENTGFESSAIRENVNSSNVSPGTDSNSSTLVGTWIMRKGTGSGYVNPTTGATSGPNATIHSYTFYADGRFEYALMMQSSLYNCTSTINGFEAGVFQDNGNTVDFYTKKATKSFKDTCRPSLNSSEPTDVRAPMRLYYRIARDEYNNLNLCVAGGNGKEICFVKQ